MGIQELSGDVLHADALEEGIYRIARKAFDYGKNILILFSSDEYLCSSDQYLVIAGESGRFLTKNLDFNRISNARTSEYRVRGMKSGNLIDEAIQTGRPATEFFWNYAFCLSQGRLIPGCRSEDVVQLRQWPNLTRVPITPNSYKITALLTDRPTSIDMAMRLLNIGAAEINQFYSAAFLSGYAEVLSRPADTNIQFKPHEHIGIIRKLLNRFRQTSSVTESAGSRLRATAQYVPAICRLSPIALIL